MVSGKVRIILKQTSCIFENVDIFYADITVAKRIIEKEYVMHNGCQYDNYPSEITRCWIKQLDVTKSLLAMSKTKAVK